MKTYILYHANCNDGFGAAYAAWVHLSGKEPMDPLAGKKHTLIEGTTIIPIPVSYQEPLPEIEDGSRVYIVDFSYPRDVLVELRKRVSLLQVIDHHKSAEKQLHGLDFTFFNTHRSGAVLTWKFFSDRPVPRVLEYVEDRDLWKWELPSSQQINTVINNTEKDFTVWATRLDDARMNSVEIVETGNSLLRQCKLQREKILQNVHVRNFLGHDVPLVNSPIHQSELGHDMLDKYPTSPFAVIYSTDCQNAWFSLRSRGDFDVSLLAERFGGGGHGAAAGFTIPISVDMSMGVLTTMTGEVKV